MTENHNRAAGRKTGESGCCHRAGQTVVSEDVAFGYSRDFLDNRFVYLVISPRARGLCIGVNVNPLVKCTFECVYCEVDRVKPPRVTRFDAEQMAGELQRTIELAQHGLQQLPRFANLPPDLLKLRHVALSGDGEPTISENFWAAMRAVNRVRGLPGIGSFKLVVVTNSTALDREDVQTTLKLLRPEDEIWAKLDGGTQAYLNRINSSNMPIEKILNNILITARQRPVTIQSLFPALNGAGPTEGEILQYALRLKELKEQGAQIPLVQIYSATRPMARVGCGHLPLKRLSDIAKTVHEKAGLKAEVF